MSGGETISQELRNILKLVEVDVVAHPGIKACGEVRVLRQPPSRELNSGCRNHRVVGISSPKNGRTHLGEHSVSCSCLGRLGGQSEPGQNDHTGDIMRSLSNKLEGHCATLRETEQMYARDIGVFHGERIEPRYERNGGGLCLIQITRERTRDGVYRDGEPGPAGSSWITSFHSCHHKARGQVRHEAKKIVGV